MAEIASDRLLFRIEILDRYRPPEDLPADQTVWLNIQVTLAVGEQILLQISLVMDSNQPEEFYRDLVRLIHEKAVESEDVWAYLCPGLSLVVRRFDSACNPKFESDEQLRNYDLWVVLNENAFFPGEQILSREGPGMYFQPNIEAILAFARDLRSEAEITRLLDT